MAEKDNKPKSYVLTMKAQHVHFRRGRSEPVVIPVAIVREGCKKIGNNEKRKLGNHTLDSHVVVWTTRNEDPD